MGDEFYIIDLKTCSDEGLKCPMEV